MQILKKPTRAVLRRTTKLSPKKVTDQKHKKSCDINNIVKSFHKTGMLPPQTKTPHYGDFSNVETLEDSFNIVNQAQDLFYSLPSDVRRLCDHDPSKLESMISDPANLDICIKNGLLEKRIVKTKNSDTINKTHDEIVKEKESQNE